MDGLFGHGIVPARMEGMATADAPQRQPTALQWAEATDGLHRVFRTTGRKAAARSQQWTDEALVKPQNENEETADHVPMICELVGEVIAAVVAAPDRVGYKDAPFPGPGS